MHNENEKYERARASKQKWAKTIHSKQQLSILSFS